MYKLLRPDFAIDWKVDKNGNISKDFFLKEGYSEADIAQFILLGYIAEIEETKKTK
jgi:hypothetical protein